MMMAMTESKKCSRCGLDKPRSEFCRRDRKFSKDGLHGVCRPCSRARAKSWSAASLEHGVPKIVVCVDCKQDKPIEAFYRNSYRKYGRQPFCKECSKERDARYKALPIEPPDGLVKCKRCKVEKPTEEFHTNQRSKNGLFSYCKSCAKEAAFKNYYGITMSDYDRMFEEQGGLCGICRRPQQDNSKGRWTGRPTPLFVDHCHVTGKVRGLLCNPCNTAIGWMKDDPETLDRAAAYLRRSL